MSLFHASLIQALSNNGNPISGALWKFYLTGTTTPAAVYADFDFGTSLGAVVTADADGRFVPIYFNDAVTYRAVLCEANGTPIEPYDVDPANDGEADIAGVDIDFEQPGANADASDLQAKGRQTVTVLDYIPKSLHAAIRAGTDITNHTPYLQAMDTDGLDFFYFPAGGYNIDTAYVPSHDQRWAGEDQSAVTLNCGVNGYVIETTVSNRRVSGEGLKIIGDTALANSGFAKLFDNSMFNWRRCAFSNFNREALRFVQGVQVSADESSFVNCGRAITATVTISNASPGVVTSTAHGLPNGTPVYLTTTGGLPTGYSASTPYYAVATTANTYQLALTPTGAGIDTSSAGSGVHTAHALPYAAVFGDPGATAGVQVNARNNYFAACGIGFQAGITRQLELNGNTFESNGIGVHSNSGEGDLSVNYWEANVIDGLLTESSGLYLGNRVGSNFYKRYLDSGAADRKTATARSGFITAYSTASQTPGGTATATTVTLSLVDTQYQATLASSEVTLVNIGVYAYTFTLPFRETSVAARNANAWLEVDNGGGYVQVPDSYDRLTLAASQASKLTVSGKVTTTVASAKVRVRFSVDNVGVTIDAAGTSGLAAPTTATAARLTLAHTGVEA